MAGVKFHCSNGKNVSIKSEIHANTKEKSAIGFRCQGVVDWGGWWLWRKARSIVIWVSSWGWETWERVGHFSITENEVSYPSHFTSHPVMQAETEKDGDRHFTGVLQYNRN